MGRKKEIGLTDQQKRFIELLVIDFDLAKSWINSDHKVKNKAVALSSAARFMLSNVDAQNYRDELLRGQKERSKKSADDVVRELEKCGFSNIADFMSVDEDGEVFIRGFDSIDREKLAVIESIKVNTTKNKKGDRDYTTTQFKLHSKLHALELLGKRFKMFTDKVEHDTSEDLKGFMSWLAGREPAQDGRSEPEGQ